MGSILHSRRSFIAHFWGFHQFFENLQRKSWKKLQFTSLTTSKSTFLDPSNLHHRNINQSSLTWPFPVTSSLLPSQNSIHTKPISIDSQNCARQSQNSHAFIIKIWDMSHVDKLCDSNVYFYSLNWVIYYMTISMWILIESFLLISFISSIGKLFFLLVWCMFICRFWLINWWLTVDN